MDLLASPCPSFPQDTQLTGLEMALEMVLARSGSGNLATELRLSTLSTVEESSVSKNFP